jgi:hypothetical protein
VTEFLIDFHSTTVSNPLIGNVTLLRSLKLGGPLAGAYVAAKAAVNPNSDSTVFETNLKRVPRDAALE